MQTRRQILSAATLAVPTILLGARLSWGQSPKFSAENGVAIDGSDAVAYFTANGPVAGRPDVTLDWMGATWRFASEANREAFLAEPQAYAPQFGGYCAWAVSKNYIAPTVPEAWTIYDGKLYLNFSRRIRRRWERDIPGNVALGEQNWPGVLA